MFRVEGEEGHSGSSRTGQALFLSFLLFPPQSYLCLFVCYCIMLVLSVSLVSIFLGGKGGFGCSADSLAFHEGPFLPLPFPHLDIPVPVRCLRAPHPQ